MFQFIQNNLKEVIAFLIAGFGIWKYFNARKNELVWKRTEFLFEQARLLDSDPDISEAIKILEDRHQSISLEEVFEGNKDYLQKFDKLFNLLDRIAYATVYQKTLSIDEVVNFGWYLKKIKNKPLLVDYCNNNGFSDIIKLAEKIMIKEDIRKSEKKAVEKSVVVPALKWMIKLFSYLSLYERLRRLFWKHHELVPFWFAEVYILGWLVLVVAGLILVSPSSALFIVLVGLSIYRLGDILAAVGRIFFIEREHRKDEMGHYLLIRHVGRWAICNLINVFEIMVCFAVLFLYLGGGFEEEIKDALTAFYQSILTITTLGYGEIHPDSQASKILVIFQLFYFLVYLLLILPRVFASIRTKEVTTEIFGETDAPDE